MLLPIEFYSKSLFSFHLSLLKTRVSWQWLKKINFTYSRFDYNYSGALKKITLELNNSQIDITYTFSNITIFEGY